jgi:hypothetical protein
MKTSTLRPGLLVSLKSSVRGNVRYHKRTLESRRVTKSGQEKERWETERTIDDKAEHEAAQQARTAARLCITGVCAWSAFGLLCPEDRSDELESAIAEARQIADVFNATAKLTRLHVYVITGRIAPDDVEAVRAINSEVRDLLEDMSRGVANLDVKAVREAANKARSIGMMLSPDASARIQIAIDTARSAARKIVKAGEQAARQIDKRAVRLIVEQRTAFLDFDQEQEVATPTVPGRVLDLLPMME